MKRSVCRRLAAMVGLGLFAAGVAQAQVIGPAAECNDDGVGLDPIPEANAFVASGTLGPCILCSVANPGFAADDAPLTFARLNTTIGIVSSVFLSVEDVTTIYPAGRRVGFIISVPDQLLSLDLLRNTTLLTSKNTLPQQRFTVSQGLVLDLLGGTNDTSLYLLSARTSREFDAVTINFGSTLRVLSALQVHSTCVSN